MKEKQFISIPIHMKQAVHHDIQTLFRVIERDISFPSSKFYSKKYVGDNKYLKYFGMEIDNFKLNLLV